VLETEGGDEIAIRQMCVFTLGFDHRLVDGAMGGQFIQEVASNLEGAVNNSSLEDIFS
jgi:2-oxoglutarate dehydrogenase E2 component (dihydrolipoamide succinyltransferase)